MALNADPVNFSVVPSPNFGRSICHGRQVRLVFLDLNLSPLCLAVRIRTSAPPIVRPYSLKKAIELLSSSLLSMTSWSRTDSGKVGTAQGRFCGRLSIYYKSSKLCLSSLLRLSWRFLQNEDRSFCLVSERPSGGHVEHQIVPGILCNDSFRYKAH